MRTGSKIQVQGTMQAWNAGGKVEQHCTSIT